MNTIRLFAIASILPLLSAFFLVMPASAHGDDPRVEISPDRLNPGSVLDIRGVDFEAEDEVRLDLVGTQTTVPFGSVLTDVEGIFVLAVVLPVDLMEGEYLIRATLSDGHTVDSAPITVWGSADLGGGEEGAREEEDGLLLPMPTAAPPASTAMLAPPATSVPPSLEQAGTNSLLPWLIVGVGVLLVSGIVLLARRRS